jgi:hypothetical protein
MRVVNMDKDLAYQSFLTGEKRSPPPRFAYDLSPFHNLKRIRIRPEDPYMSILPIRNVPDTVHDLEMILFPSSPMICQEITAKCASIRALCVIQSAAWCSLCNLEEVLELRDLPRALTYTGGVGLPVSQLSRTTDRDIIECFDIETVCTISRSSPGAYYCQHYSHVRAGSRRNAAI